MLPDTRLGVKLHYGAYQIVALEKIVGAVG